MKGIQEKIKEGNKDFEEGNDIVIEIIRMLCKQFFKNRFSSFGERPHPFIYYKFLRIIQDWTPEIFNDIKDYKNEWTSQKKEDWELKYFVEGVEKKGSKAIFDYFFSEGKIYDDAKYEMYRQMALYNAADMSLFDVKRLIYSLLIAKMNDKYSNNLIKDKVLKLIFDEQLDTNTGLFPVGHVVNTDFVIEGGEIVDKTERIISASPILSSVECLDDMLTHKVWIVTSLLPMFQKLREQKDIKFILATNDITKVDIAAKRPGRIDAVLPMGAICWQDRLKILRDAISDGNNQIKYLRYAEPQNIFSGLLAENKLKNNKQIDEMVKDDINKDLERFLKQSDFMPFIELKSIVEMLFNKRDWETAKNTEAFKILFSKEDSGRDKYENSEFKKFHKNLVGEPEKTEDKLDKYVHLPMEAEISKGEYIKGVKNTVFWES